MVQYYQPEYRLTMEAADALAASNRALDSMLFGAKMNGGRVVGPAATEYTTCAVNTRGTGNCGRVYLRGLTPRARAIVRAGKVARLVQAGCPEKMAQVAASMPYGMENQVWGAALDLIGIARHVPGTLKRARRARGHAALDRVLSGYDAPTLAGLSWPRKQAAITLAAWAMGA